MKRILLLTICFLLLTSSIARAEYWVKEDTDEWFPVVLLDSTDGVTEETGKAFGDTTVEYAAEGATSWTAYTDDTNTFKENGDGCYWLQMGASEFSDNKRYFVRVEVSGCLPYRFIVEAIDNSRNEAVTSINNIETDTGTTLDGKINTIDGIVDDILVDTGTTLPGTLSTISGYVDTEVADILTDTGTTLPSTLTNMAGATFDTGTDSLEALRNRGDAEWITAVGFSTHSAADVKTAMEADGSKLDHLWETTEDDGGVRRYTANSLEEAPTGGSAPTVEEIRAEIDSNSTQLAAIVEDTGTTLPGTLSTIEGKIDAVDDYLDTEIAAILEDTGTTLPATLSTIEGKIDTIDGIVDNILVDTGTTLDGYLDTEIAAILADTNELQTNQGNWLTATSVGLTDAGVDAVWDEVITGHATADSFGKVFDTEIDGLRTYGDTNWATATGFSTLTAANVWETNISAYSGAGYAGTYLKNLYDNQGNWLTATGFSTHSAADVWDVTLSEHLGAGTTGFALNAAGAAGDPWSTALPGAYGAGSAGYIVGTYINASVSSRLASAGYTAPDNASITLILEDTGTTLPGTLSTISGKIDTAQADLDNPSQYKATGFSTHSAADVKTALEADGSKLDHLWETTEDDGGVRRFTENALEEAPTGGAGASDWTDNEKTEIKAVLGVSGTGTPADPSTGILDTIRNIVNRLGRR